MCACIRSGGPTVEYVDLDGLRLLIGRATRVLSAVGHLAASDDEDADEHLRFDLLRDDQAVRRIGVYFRSALEPFDVVGWFRFPRGVTDQLNR